MVTNSTEQKDLKRSLSSDMLVEASNIVKIYGVTKAVDDMKLSIHTGEVVGLVGANGAGKSTLTRIVSGVTRPTEGEMRLLSENIDFAHYSAAYARKLGVRVVYQELSLCTNLKVYENFYLEQNQRLKGSKWRKDAYAVAKEALDLVFPNNNIEPSEEVGNLTIAQRQMVEISRAASDPDLKLLILDEPTSSLGAEQAIQLQDFIMKAKKRGISFIFITHKLKEILAVSDTIVIMSNGKLKWCGEAAEVTEEELVEKMSGSGGIVQISHEENYEKIINKDGKNLKIDINNLNTGSLHDINVKMYGGEIIGVAGLEGSGQKALLHTCYEASKKKKNNAISINDTVAFVSGDRAKEGVFPLWSIIKNMTVTKLTKYSDGLVIDKEKEIKWGEEWFEKLKVKSSDLHAPILSLSGGNQQKIMIARALLSNAKIIFLDDPSRGVDVETKRQLFQLYKEAAEEGKVIIWYSTEDEELTGCDRVLVMRDGHVVKELEGNEITKDKIIESSFINVKKENKEEEKVKDKKQSKLSSYLKSRTLMPFIAMVLIFAAIGAAHPEALSGFGISLLLGSAIPLVLAAISQMFIITASDIDLGLGAYLGFTNVVSAILLVTNPSLGIITLLLGIAGYAVLAALIHMRKIPAIVVSLGASFIWLGTAVTIQAKPGGSSPEWLSKFFNLPIPAIPEPVILSLVIAVIAYLIIIYSPYGTVLRGFGNNPKSIERSGWSTLKARVSLYILAALFGTFAGLSLTGITTAADANSASSYTLLTIASVVLGGGELEGGIVEPFGVVFGAITLSMIGAFLGFVNIGSNFQPAFQGGLLFLILAIRISMRRKKNEN